MIGLGVIIGLIILFIGIHIYTHRDSYSDDGLGTIAIGIIVIFIFAFTAIIEFIPKAIELELIDDKIAMYEEENAQIEEDVERIVAQYQQHEKAVFDMSEIHSATTLIQMYPDLKSNDLAMKQIEIYNQNNAQIKSLKLDQIDCEKAKWWLYFGKIGE